jgi:hypothetical protein
MKEQPNRSAPFRRRAGLEPQEGSEVEWAMHRQARRTVWLSLFSMVAASLACVFTGLQWWEVHSGRDASQRLTEAATSAAIAAQSAATSARQQADAAVQQARIAAETASLLSQSLEAQRRTASAANVQAKSTSSNLDLQRPRIAISFSKPQTFRANTPTTALVTYRNTSNFPADALHTDAFVEIWPYPPDSEKIRRELMMPRYLAEGNQSKLESQESNFGHPPLSTLTQKQIDEVESGNGLRLLVAAVAVYRDERGKTHHSFGCSTWSGPGLTRQMPCYVAPDD